MAAETVAWFLFGNEREDWLFDPGMSPWPRAMFWLRFSVREWREMMQRRRAYIVALDDLAAHLAVDSAKDDC